MRARPIPATGAWLPVIGRGISLGFDRKPGSPGCAATDTVTMAPVRASLRNLRSGRAATLPCSVEFADSTRSASPRPP